MAYSYFKPFNSAQPDRTVSPGRLLWQPALDCPETLRAARRWWIVPAITIGIGVLLYVLTAPGNGGDDDPHVFAIIAVLGGVASVPWVYFNRRRLANHPWAEWPGMFVQEAALADYSPLLVLVGPDGARHVLRVSTQAWTRRRLAKAEGRVWFCGDPDGFGLVSLPGGEHPVLVMPPYLSGRRARAAADAVDPG